MQKIESKIEVIPTKFISNSYFKRKPAERNTVIKLRPSKEIGDVFPISLSSVSPSI